MCVQLPRFLHIDMYDSTRSRGLNLSRNKSQDMEKLQTISTKCQHICVLINQIGHAWKVTVKPKEWCHSIGSIQRWNLHNLPFFPIFITFFTLSSLSHNRHTGGFFSLQRFVEFPGSSMPPKTWARQRRNWKNFSPESCPTLNLLGGFKHFFIFTNIFQNLEKH